MNRRQLLLPVGLLAVGVGIVLTFRPGLVPGGFVTTLFVLCVWTLALGGTAVAVVSRLSDDVEERDRLPTASERPAYRVPGDALGDRTAAVGASERHAAERDRIRARVRAAAVAVLARREGHSPAEAGRRVDDGRWTDDADSSALFTGGDSQHDHVETAFARRVERAADEIVQRYERGDDG